MQDLYTKNAKAVGGAGNSFAPITCFGPNCAEPHHDNDGTRIKSGDSVIIDVGLLHNRYISDMTRTVFFGHATDEQKRVYEVCRGANEAGRAAVRPGVPMCEFDRAARRVIEDAGLGKYFIHRTGHGIGLEVHEHPDNSSVSQIIAEPLKIHHICKSGAICARQPAAARPGRLYISRSAGFASSSASVSSRAV